MKSSQGQDFSGPAFASEIESGRDLSRSLRNGSLCRLLTMASMRTSISFEFAPRHARAAARASGTAGEDRALHENVG